MTERAIFQLITEYVANCAWQIPLLAGGAWLLVKAIRPEVLAQHWLWLAVLAMAVVLPGRGIDVRPTAARAAHELLVPDSDRFVGTPGPKASLVGTASFREPRSVEDLKEPTQGIAGSLRSRRIRLGITATQWLVRIYFATVLFGAVRFLRAWFAARRLVRESREVTLGVEAMRVFEAFARRLGVRRPCLRESDGITGPVIVGVLRPVLLTPENFAAYAEEEIGAALCHELAHVRRKDYLVNLICQVVALPVAWHPAVYAVQQRIRRTREMVCDAIAAEEMESGAGYARCLVSLAQQMVNGSNITTESQAMGLFENGTIEERVMKLTETKAVVSGRTRVLRGVCGGSAMLLVIGAAATFHVRPTFAESEIVVQSAVAPAAPPLPAPSPQAKPSAAVAKRNEAAPVITLDSHAKFIVGKGDYVHRWKGANGEPFTVINDDVKEPSEEEKRDLEQEAEDSKKSAEEATRWVNGPEFQKQMAEIQKTVDSTAMKAQIEAAERIANDPAMKLHMEELQKQLSHLDAMPELQKFNDPEWQKQFAELQKNQPKFDFKFDFDKQMAITKLSMDQTKLNDKIAIVMKDNEKQMAKLQKEIESGELKAKLDAAQRMLDEVRAKMEKMQAK